MKDVYELLREKETVILRLRQEIEALRCVIPLLSDDLDQPDAETSEWQGLDAPEKKAMKLIYRPEPQDGT